jgi:hypothetical protein
MGKLNDTVFACSSQFLYHTRLQVSGYKLQVTGWALGPGHVSEQQDSNPQPALIFSPATREIYENGPG